jgi:hypothetical protein
MWFIIFYPSRNSYDLKSFSEPLALFCYFSQNSFKLSYFEELIHVVEKLCRSAISVYLMVLQGPLYFSNIC